MTSLQHNILRHFLESVQQNPQKTALIDGSRKFTFLQLKEKAAALAAEYRHKGIGSGDRVLVYIPMSTELYVVLLAILWNGAIAVFIDSWSDTKRVSHCLQLAPCKAMVCGWKLRLLSFFLPAFKSIQTKLPLHSNREGIDPVEVDKDLPALITFTTGSTDVPKGSVRSHNYLSLQFRALSKIITPAPEHVNLVTLPIVLLMNFAAGTTSIMAGRAASNPKKLKVKALARLIIQHKVKRVTASPSVLFQLSKHADYPEVCELFTGGGPVFPSDAEAIKTSFPNADFRIIYGSTEAEPVSATSGEDLIAAKRAGAKGILAGSPVAEIAVRIIRYSNKPVSRLSQEEFEKFKLPQNEPGEIIVQGEHVLNEYVVPQQFLHNKITEGEDVWHRMGDCGYLNEQGRLFLLGRCSEIIKTSQAVVYPFQAEQVFAEIAAVKEGAIVKIKDEIIAAVVSDGESTEQHVLEILKNRDLHVDRIVFLSRLPKDPRHFSKIDYEKLRKILIRKL